jgi:uncharacterized protein
MIFEIHAERIGDNDKKIFFYDNETNTLKTEDNVVIEYPKENIKQQDLKESLPFDKNNPIKKSKDITLLKIQLGLSCNYSCDYCSQKFVERAPETNKKDIDAFLEKLDVLNFSEENGLKIEFWGGEPFVYWKTLKPLAEALRERFAHWKKEPQFSVITNGSILTKEICAWLYYMGFTVAISHDGPGQSVRGPDPFEDPAQKKIVLDFYKIMKKQNRISFNSMLNAQNQSRKAIHNWFIEFTNDEGVPLGEGTIVDAYDQDGAQNSLNTKEDHFNFRKLAFNDIYSNNGNIGFITILSKVDTFVQSVLSHKDAKFVGQKCGMDLDNTLAIDLRGNVMTCQNVSPVEIGMNGESHFSGTLENYDDVEVKTATHWRNRKECSGCPVLHICHGSCMFLDGELWEISCNNAYSDNVALFALGFEKMTKGYVPVLIKNDSLPLDRQDIWGTQFEHKEKTKKKIIPIKIVSEVITKIDEIEVYGKSRVEA